MKSRIRLAGIDLDGTLLRSDKTISPATAEALKSAAARGIILVPVTGRPLSGIPRALLRLGVFDYAITTNGAAVTELKSGKTLLSRPLPREKSLSIMRLLDERGVEYEAFAEGRGYLSRELFAAYAKSYAGTPIWEYLEASRTAVSSVRREFEGRAAGADEIFARLENGARRDMLARELEGDCGLKLCLLEKNFLEITDRKTDKGAAFEFLCGKLGIKKENTAAFGDNSNDLPLLKAAGTFIAMGNAPQELKNSADCTADTNDNDSVAKTLNKF